MRYNPMGTIAIATCLRSRGRFFTPKPWCGWVSCDDG